MESVPYCTACGQDEEFIIIDEHRYICICGYQFSCFYLLPSKTIACDAPSPLPSFEFHIH
ncbi:hypothetical protein PSSHI_26660 [Photobacterium sp. R1]